MVNVNTNLLWLIVGTFGTLAVGTGVRLIALRNSTTQIVRKRLGSLKVWWVLAILWSAAAVFGKIGAAVLLATASWLAMREYLRFLKREANVGISAGVVLLLCGAAHYLLIVTGQREAATWFLPLVCILLLGAVRATTCTTRDYIRTTAGMFWGAMLLIYALSHALYLFDIDTPVEPTTGTAGPFLFLILLTEANDIMQAIVGRKLGKTKITPEVSPNKSAEGLIGGLLTTGTLSVVLAPFMTTLTLGRGAFEGVLVSLGAGLAISLAGFLGDINMSAIKRDVGVKDGSAILPGMGGIIDRIDSLTFTAPVFYLIVLLANQIHFNL